MFVVYIIECYLDFLMGGVTAMMNGISVGLVKYGSTGCFMAIGSNVWIYLLREPEPENCN